MYVLYTLEKQRMSDICSGSFNDSPRTIQHLRGPIRPTTPHFGAVELSGDLRDPASRKDLWEQAASKHLMMASALRLEQAGAAVRHCGAPGGHQMMKTAENRALGAIINGASGLWTRPAQGGPGSQWKRCIFMAVYRTEIRMNLYIMGKTWWSNGKICFQKWQWIYDDDFCQFIPMCPTVWTLFWGCCMYNHDLISNGGSYVFTQYT